MLVDDERLATGSIMYLSFLSIQGTVQTFNRSFIQSFVSVAECSLRVREKSRLGHLKIGCWNDSFSIFGLERRLLAANYFLSFKSGHQCRAQS